MLKWLWLSVMVIIFDQLTKNMATQYLDLHQPAAIFSGFNLMLAYNTGAAFSFLADAGGWQRWFFAILSGGKYRYAMVDMASGIIGKMDCHRSGADFGRGAGQLVGSDSVGSCSGFCADLLSALDLSGV